MAVIQKIREKYAKLAGFVIALSLVAFIVSEGINGSFKNFFGADNSVVKVDGQGIDGKEYMDAVADYASLTELYRKGQPVKDEELANLRQGVLDQLINEKLIEKEAKKLGLVVSEQEEKDMFYGTQPDPTVQQFPYFADQQTGQFNPQMVKEFEKAVKKGGRSAEESDQLSKMNAQWLALKKFMLRQRLVAKYTALVSNSAYSPKYVIERSDKDANMQAGVRFVKIPFTTIEDSKVPVTDADLNAYVEKHKAQFEATLPTRSIDYVVYDIVPDAQDTLKARGALQKVRDTFVTTSDNEKFVNRNSDGRYSDTWVTKATYMSAFSDSIFNMPVGGVYGPYFEKDNYKLTKVVAKTTLPDSVKCRHILIKTADQGGKPLLDSATAKAKIDSIAAAIAGGADFKAMVTQYTNDEGSKEKGGEYDFTLAQRSTISKEFGDFIFEGKPGEHKIVYANNQMYAGFHYIEIISQKNMVSAVKLADVTKELITSGRSSSAINSRANKFAGTNANGKAFDEAVKREGLNARVAEDIKPGDFVIPGLGAARDLVQWAFKAKEGEVSDPIQLDKKFVVAKVSAIQEPGIKKMTTAMKAQVEAAVRNEKKATMIADMYKGLGSLDAIAQKSNQAVLAADSIKGNTSQQQIIGYEPKVLGYIFNDKLQPNVMSPALKGREGVFFVMLTHRETLPVSPTDKMMQEQQRMMEASQNKNFINSMLGEALKRGNTIKYNTNNIR